MSLQDIFYIVGIVAMVFFIVFSILSIYLVLFIKKVVNDTERKVVNKIVEYTRPVDVFKGLSTSILGNIFIKLRDNFGMR